jgi:hypothetical protein
MASLGHETALDFSARPNGVTKWPLTTGNQAFCKKTRPPSRLSSSFCATVIIAVAQKDDAVHLKDDDSVQKAVSVS